MPNASAIACASTLAALWSELLGQRLAGVYLIGSLAHGGYSAIHSDIDLALINKDALTDAELDQIRSQTLLKCPDLAPKISLFWADETFSEGRFPLLDRIDYIDHRRMLIENWRILPARPTLCETRIFLRVGPLRKWSEEVARLSALSELSDNDRKVYMRAILYPARFLYSWWTGSIASNDDAVTYVLERGLIPLEADLLISALRCRNSAEDISLLFPERHRLQGLLRTCSRYATG